ncbi:MAG: aminopeptidase P N-terminal domain-containing protein [Oscillospiraceae bacterium]|nr:aminopeptidase P N-terminal domain-containing protein [Oscillospiraceae bacterium]
MNAAYFAYNRSRFYERMQPSSLLILFSGVEIRKTSDEFYPFFAERNFVYLTGLACKEAVFLAEKDGKGAVRERLYILPPDFLAERWTGRRVKPYEAEAVSGIRDVRFVESFPEDVKTLLASDRFATVYLDCYRHAAGDMARPAHGFADWLKGVYPAVVIGDASSILRSLRTIKHPEEIQALREAEKKTRAGILAMMKASHPGIYEYQYKAEFDRALAQFGPEGPGFPSIISAGENNFCIHYYSYTGQAHDGDMVLNDVGAQHSNMITDVSRGWPCNGRFTEKQKLLYECALATSDYMFSVIKPGMRMEDVDATIKRYNFERLKDAGVLKSFDEIGKLMWHGGSHHIGYDVHDFIQRPEILKPNMVFCVDVGIYHEEWSIGFRLEDNCLVTENGCENLSREIPRTVADLEAVMRKG